jgi:non-specific serine/threonine protein kinase
VPPSGAVAATAGAAERPFLPADLTRLVGRQREVAEVRALLAGGRLVTLTGAGGSGKTRLALAVAAEADFPDGIHWVELAALTEPHCVPRHLADACGLRDDPGVPPEELLLGALAPHAALLVLDNCEHLVEACAGLVDRLLRGCPRLTVLATSREALGVAGEQAWLVPPLGLPPAGDDLTVEALLTAPAAELFVERARAARPGFAPSDGDAAAVAHICRRLDGLPLALELAAARIKVLTPADLAHRLDDAFAVLTAGARTAPPRQRTLRATLDWSYHLLAAPERTALRRLAVFAGSFALPAAEDVVGDDGVAAGTVLDRLAALVDRSLLTVEPCCERARYRLLETVRQYAAEQLAAAGEREGAARRHARHYVDLAEHAEPRVFGGDGDEGWMRRLDEEAGELRAAFEHCALDPDGPALALRLAYALHWHWFTRGHFREARERLSAALAAAGDDAEPRLRCRALAALAHVALWLGDAGEVRRAAERAVALLPDDADADTRGYTLDALGIAQHMAGDHALAIASCATAAEAAEAGHPVLAALACYWRGRSELAQGDLAGARASLERALGIGRRLGHRPATGHPLCILGRVHELAGDEARAAECWCEALSVHLGSDDGWGFQEAVEGVARLALAAGDVVRGARLLAAAEAAREHLGSLQLPDEEVAHRRAVEAAREALGEPAFAVEWAAGRLLTRPEAVALAASSGPIAVAEACCGPAAVVPHPDLVPLGLVGPSAAPPAGVAAPAVATADVEVRALGSFGVWRAGERLEGEVWGPSKPRELLLFLLTRPGGAGREQVGLALWPDASAAQLRNSFHVTLHRLRRALGDGDLVRVTGDLYATAPALVAAFDAHRFDELATTALRDAAAGRSGAAGRLAEALALYRGELLAGEPVPEWALELRERLAGLHRQTCHAHGGLLLAAGRTAEAADAFAGLLEADVLDEEACRQLMTCQVRLNRRSEALRLYRRLADRLRAELDTEPDPATTDLFERLQDGGRP